MGYPKRKTNITVYNEKILTERRQEMLDNITKSDTYLPDSILHDDLDKGMLDYVKTNFDIISDGTQVPIIDKILTIQRWAEFTNNWSFTDEDRNVQLPFIAIIRKPDVQLGTNPSVQRTVPKRYQFYYASVPTWNGTEMGSDIYTIPQPVPVDITYEVTIICTKFRDVNKFNKKVLQHFSARQDYTVVKGHYIPIVLESNEDNTPMEILDGRRFYVQTYKFTMLGFLIDSDEFEVKPAVNRFFLMNEFIKSNNYEKKYINKSIEIIVATFIADGMQISFSVGETINILFNVAINGLLQVRDVDYYHLGRTSKITFVTPPLEGSITITYYRGKNSVFIDTYGKPVQVSTEYFTYTGSTTFTLLNTINSIVSLDINGLTEDEGPDGYEIISRDQVRLTHIPVIGSKIGITYIY